MNKAVFERIREVVYDHSGINISPGKESMVESRLGRRLRHLKLPSAKDYLRHLESDFETEIVELLDVISTNVTSFFREPEHFEFLTEVLVSKLEAGQKRLRLWCAASSTGEEPYTIAMTVREAMRTTGSRADVRILATDISTKVLEKARAGRFAADRIETIPTELRERYFEAPDEKGSRRARATLRDLLCVRRLNLSKPPFPMKGPLDAVFCRNVMIYFDNRVRLGLTGEFERLIAADGLLVLGKSESLVQENDHFKRVGPSVYRVGGRA